MVELSIGIAGLRTAVITRDPDVATVVRDWLLGHGAISTSVPVGLSGSEADKIVALFGVSSLSDPVTSVSGLESKLRPT